MSCPARLYPLRKPANHKPPVPRWHLILPEGVDTIFTVYVGVQQHRSQDASATFEHATSSIRTWLKSPCGPPASEEFNVIDGNDTVDSAVWVCYWTDAFAFEESLGRLSLFSLYVGLSEPGRASIGLWMERFTTLASRLETNYSGLDYLPGVSRIPGTSTIPHELTAYWGAARDRVPDAAHDLFESPSDYSKDPPKDLPRGLGQCLTGTNHDNAVHIRSGQRWEMCSQQEADAYEQKLEPALEAGLGYLRDNRCETGTLAIRYLRNSGSRLMKETCGAGFFANMADLENWAKTHPSHLAIYRGALAHFKAFGESRMLRTWHEVSVLRAGDARFEYINCVPSTGVIGSVSLKVQEI